MLNGESWAAHFLLEFAPTSTAASVLLLTCPCHHCCIGQKLCIEAPWHACMALWNPNMTCGNAIMPHGLVNDFFGHYQAIAGLAVGSELDGVGMEGRKRGGGWTCPPHPLWSFATLIGASSMSWVRGVQIRWASIQGRHSTSSPFFEMKWKHLRYCTQFSLEGRLSLNSSKNIVVNQSLLKLAIVPWL